MGIKVKEEDMSPSTPAESVHTEKKNKKRKKKENEEETVGKKAKLAIKIEDPELERKLIKKLKKEKRMEESPVLKDEAPGSSKKEKKTQKQESDLETSERRRKKKSLIKEEESEVEGSRKAKAKFSISVATSSILPSLDTIKKKKKGPKIIIAQSDGDSAAGTTAAERKQRKNRNKKKKGDKEGAIHESKGMNKALRYLKSWKEDRTHWKFEKCRQIWLLHNAYDHERVSETTFPVLLEYIASIRGAMRDQTRQEAQLKKDKAAQWQAKFEAEVPEADIITELGPKIDGKVLERAEKILECLENS